MRIIAPLIALFVSAPVWAGPAECFDQAYGRFQEYAYEQAVHLCKRSQGLEAVNCLDLVRARGLFRVDPERRALSLCAGAQNAEATIACYETAHENYGDPARRASHAINLCSNVGS